jgi:hypothetical protein
MGFKRLHIWALALMATLAVSGNAIAVIIPQNGITVETELFSMDLFGGPIGVPLASDPGNLLGDSVDGYGYVNSLVQFSLSVQRTPTPGPASPGTSQIYSDGATGPVDVQDGDELLVDSFFDVFFDITFVDVDTRPVRDYAGMADGASVQFLDNHTTMDSSSTCLANTSQNNFGCLPQVGSYFLGFFDVVIPLGGDINGNGIDELLKFTLGTLSVGSVVDSFTYNGYQYDTFNSNLDLDGLVLDVTADPPFSSTLLGPTTARQPIVIPAQTVSVPVVATPVLMGLGLICLSAARRRCSRS